MRLLSIGEEDEKGNALTLEAHALLREERALNFAGNAESRDLLRGAADVVVTDGFTGNVALKLLEGTIREAARRLPRGDHRDAAGKLGGLLIRPAARRLRTGSTPTRYGGAVPARPAGPGGDRARQLERARDPQRDPPRRHAGSSTRSSSGSPSGSRSASGV